MAKRGRPTTDLSLLSRNRLWAWTVYCESSARSWDALDKIWLEKIDTGYPTQHLAIETRSRRRVLHRIFRQATDPASVRGLNGNCLLDVVDASGNHPIAKALYHSELWKLLGPRELSRTELEEMKERLLMRLRLFQATPQELAVARLAGLQHPAFSRDEVELTRTIDGLTNDVNADKFALLGCCYRIAMHDVALLEANLYLIGLRNAFHQFHSDWALRTETYVPLQTLMDARLLRMRVAHLDLGAAEVKVRRRSKQKNQAPALPFEPSLIFSGYEAHRPPIVAIDTATLEFNSQYRSHFDAALKALKVALVDASRNAHDPETDRPWRPDTSEELAECFLGDIKMRNSPAS